MLYNAKIIKKLFYIHILTEYVTAVSFYGLQRHKQGSEKKSEDISQYSCDKLQKKHHEWRVSAILWELVSYCKQNAICFENSNEARFPKCSVRRQDQDRFY